MKSALKLVCDPLCGLGALIGRALKFFMPFVGAWSDCKGLAYPCLAFKQRNPSIIHSAKYEDLAVSRPTAEQIGSLRHEPGAAAEVDSLCSQFRVPRGRNVIR
jgi:hypothetical protein